MARESGKERYLYYNNLTCVLKGLEKQYTTIDLRNESCVTGKIKYVDGFMNVDMEDAIFYDAMGTPHKFDSFFIQARLIRFVHIPKNLPATTIVQNQLDSFKVPVYTQDKTSFKARRANQYQKEIVNEVTIKEEPSQVPL